jgi:hypothetical protein
MQFEEHPVDVHNQWLKSMQFQMGTATAATFTSSTAVQCAKSKKIGQI